MSKSSSSTRLIMKGLFHIPTFIPSPLQIRGSMVNAALSPHRVPEIPYYDRSCSRKARAPSPVYRNFFIPTKSQENALTRKRPGKANHPANSVHISRPALLFVLNLIFQDGGPTPFQKYYGSFPFHPSRQFSNAHLGSVWLLLNRTVERY